MIGLFAAASAQAQQPRTGLFYYAAQNLQTGEVEQRGIAGSNGVAFDNLLLTPNTPYRLWLLQAATLRIDDPSVITNNAGQRTQAPDFSLHDDGSPDSDGDGLHDDSEFILGTDPTNLDSNGDGVPDGPEVQQGLDPLGGLGAAARTGVIAQAATPGTAKDVCTFNDVAVVADQEGGVSVFNVFNGMSPVIIAQVDTPGTADRVACAGNLIAVADGGAGLAVIDITDPRTAHILHQVPLEAAPQAVTTAANIAFAGLANGKVVAVDMTTGAALAQVLAGGGPVQDLRIAGDVLYVLAPYELQTYSLQPDFLHRLGRITTSNFYAEGITHTKRLFVGGGLAYVTAYPGYDVIGVSDARAPRMIAPIIDTLATASFKQIVANGSGLGVAAAGVNPRPDGTHDVWLYDVTVPADNTRLKTVLTTPGIAQALSLFNGQAYVADSGSGLEAVNYLAYDKQKQAPSISLSTNFAPGLAEENKIMRVTATVTDDVQVRNVEFYLDGTKVATDGDFPFEIRFVVPPLARQGGFTLRARASDTGGNATFTDEMRIRIVLDATPPAVTQVSPTDGVVTSGLDAAAAFFSEPINPASLSGFTLASRKANGTFVPVPGTAVQYRDAVNGAFIGVGGPLPVGRYMATLPATVADVAGNQLGAAVSWSFTIFDRGSDRDHDCIPDSLEPLLGLNPDTADSDGNGTPDGDEDFDHDHLSNCGEVILGTDPANPFSYGDGILDGDHDVDGDGLTDGEEVFPGIDGYRTDPLSADTDGGGVDDGAEDALGTNPTNPSDDTRDLAVSGRTLALSGRLRLNSLSLTNGAVLTQGNTGSGHASRLEVAVAGTLNIDATSRIDATASGFLGGFTGSNASPGGQTIGSTTTGGSTGRSGGSHGGLGGLGTINDPNTAGMVYDDPRDPAQPGAGGAAACPTGNNSGGGLVRITASTLQLDGVIVADGGSTGNGCAGGGAGGSIKLQVGTLKGGGSVHANGGSAPGGGNGTGGGGGGRVAVFYGDASGFTLTNIAALGGSGSQNGAPGTIFLQHSGDLGELIVRGSGPETPLPEGFTTDRMTIDGARVAVSQGSPTSLTLRNGAVLTHPAATTTNVNRLDLRVGTLSIDAQSSIDVTGRGFLGGVTGGNGDPTGRTFGNVAGSSGRSGGSHGGPGALGTVNNPNLTGAVYDDFRDPMQPGGGGATACGVGNNSGGGVVHITADAMQLDGLIVADGASTGNGCSGGGAGGSIKVEVGTLSGVGSIRADGGNVPGGGFGTGGGGGGRLAIVYDTNNGLDLDTKVEAVGGVGSAIGAMGTVYLRPVANATGALRIDGKGQDPSRATPLYSLSGGTSTALGPNTLEDTTAAFIPGSLVGLALHPDVAHAKTFRIIANDATTLTTDPTDGDLRTATAAGSEFGAAVELQQLLVRDHAVVEVVNGDQNRPDRRGQLSATDIDVLGTAQLIHPPASSATVYGLELEAAETLHVDETSRIDASGRGFLGGATGDNATATGRTRGNTTSGGSSGRSGGSHGGLGGVGTINDPNTVAAIYGDLRDPNEPGAGGATACGAGNNSGGGVVRVAAGTVRLDGVITADGASTGNGCSGGGAGGSIKLQVAALGGTGSIHANGGSAPGGGNGSGGGGGGRVAVFFDASNALPLANIAAVAGSGSQNGAAGTIFVQKTGSLGDLFVRGAGTETPLPEGFATDRLVIDGALVSVSSMHPAALTLQNGAVLTQPAATTTTVPRMDLQVGTLTVDASSAINVSGRGLLGGLTGTNTDAAGRTKGNVAGSTGRSGGSHGGLGGVGFVNNPNAAAAVYDDVRDPNEPGGGGATACLPGNNNGGGVLRLAATTVQLDGMIAADGASSQNGCAGGGAGGSIALAVGTLKGGGSMHANGGSVPGGGSGTGAGGGGRVAVIYDNAAMFTLANVATLGGVASQNGAPGSIFLQQRGQLGELIVRGGGERETPLPENFATDRMTIDGARVAVSQSSPTSLALRNGAVLTHPGASTTDVYGLDLHVGALSIDALSSIDVTGRGFLGGATGDNGDASGRTFGNAPGSTGRSGGSHGGPGAVGVVNNPNITGAVYDDFRDPSQPGGGGATACGVGNNNGGGIVRVTADAMQLDGLIAADGGSTGNGCAGGGAGGSINLEIGTLSGTGSIRADGGHTPGGGNGTGGGGAGRVAIVYQTNNGFDLDTKVEAVGGVGSATGAMGTVYLRPMARMLGTLRIDGKGNDPSRATPLYALRGGKSTVLSANTLTDGAAAFIPGALVGLEVQPNVAQAKTFTVIANDATTISTDPADGDLRTVAVAGNTYGAAIAVDQFLVRDHAVTEVVDGDQNRTDRRGLLTATRVDIVDGAQLVHPPASSATVYGLELDVSGTLAVDASSRIDASARGFLGGFTGDNASASGLTAGNTASGGSTGRSGGSHGGLGGMGTVDNPNSAGSVYGDPNDPDEPGAGGGTACNTGNNSGGGVVRITAGTIQLNGAIAADGGNTGNGCAGGGAGGAIKLDVGTLSGTGTIHTNGGSAPGGGNGTGGGGGGRVAVFYTNAAQFTPANTQSFGGSGTSDGSPGSIVFQQAP